MLGAARIVAVGSRACVLDFGGSFVKRALAHYTADGLSRLEIREPLPSDFPASDDDPGAVFERMADIIAQAYGEADAPTIAVSLAAYVDAQGQPAQAQGGVYTRLAQHSPDAAAAFSRAVGERLGRRVDVRLLHDSTAAALFYAPMPNAAVVMLGTALGSGYPVERPALPLRPVSAALGVE
jgi:predicted NBD/HSP70 family sugar kinase